MEHLSENSLNLFRSSVGYVFFYDFCLTSVVILLSYAKPFEQVVEDSII